MSRSLRTPTVGSRRRPGALVNGLLTPDQLPLLGHGALHQEHEEHEPQAQDGEQPEDVEVGQGRRLLLTEIGSDWRVIRLRPGRIARLLHEVGLTLTEEGLHVLVQRAEVLAHAGQVELLAPLLDDLVDRHAHAAPLVAEQGEQADRGRRRCGGV